LSKRDHKGFTLVELLVSLAVGVIVVSAAVLLFSQSLSSAHIITAGVDVEQTVRVALDQMAKDITAAGTNIPKGGITIPPGSLSGISPQFGCAATKPPCFVANNHFLNGVLYSVMPGSASGPVVLNARSDAIAVLYEDPLLGNPNPDITPPPLAWNSFPITPAFGQCPAFGNVSADGRSVTMPAYTVLAPGPDGLRCTADDLTAPLTPSFTDPSVNLQVGDLMMLSFSNVGTTVGVVTALDPASATMTFGPLDPLNMNLASAGVSPIANFASLPGSGSYPPVTVSRVLLVSYFLEGLDSSGLPVLDAAAPVDARLMRQVNALPPVPVADHVVGLKVSYDIAYNDAEGVIVGTPDASPAPPNIPGALPSEIRKVHITVTARSTHTDSRGNYTYSALTTTVSPRNMAFLGTQ
jgi:prepilin-type N-terminal cleavage/methylation domain-containing protein